MQDTVVGNFLPIFLFAVCVVALAAMLLLLGNLFSPSRPSRVKRMPYESGMDPIHDTRRRFDVRFYLVAVAFLVFDVELLFLYPWAVAARPATVERPSGPQAALSDVAGSEAALRGIDAAVAKGQTERGRAQGYVENRHLVFGGVMIFIALLTLGFIYDWRKGIFQWR